ncbi:MAG TPA: mechanosensitive ion channel domain-containing protein [Gemmatimonadales bacterium]|nr:mechanosensitive ion channel domain-containing protein [Gemmatimonadales bacterium]
MDWITPPAGWPHALWVPLVVLASAAAGALAHLLLTRLLDQLYRRRRSPIGAALVAHVRRPTRVLAALFAAQLAAQTLVGDAELPVVPRRLLALALIGALAWTLTGIIEALVEIVEHRHPIDAADNLRQRRVRTQVEVLRRVAVGLVVFVAIAAALTTFPSVRSVGASLFASAGVAGLVVGFAARPALSNLIAGLQLAFTEPIRLDDVVVLEGEFGRIEEIAATYVVVRVWDERRLILPLSYFLEHPFQNWTRTAAELLGTVYLWVDYSVPVPALRAELERVLRASPLWDGRAWGLQVTDASDRAVQVRALMSAPSAGAAWNLRCEVREALIGWLQANHPGGLPQVRALVATAGAGAFGAPAPELGG